MLEHFVKSLILFCVYAFKKSKTQLFKTELKKRDNTFKNNIFLGRRGLFGLAKRVYMCKKSKLSYIMKM